MLYKEKQKEAAEKFAKLIQQLAEDGCIDALSIKIKAESSDELYRLAQALGIEELSVTAHIGA